MLYKILNAILPKNFLQLENLRKSFPLLVLEILYSHCLLILLIYTKHKGNKMKSWADPPSQSLEGGPIQRVERAKKRLNNSFPYKQGDKMLPLRSRFQLKHSWCRSQAVKLDNKTFALMVSSKGLQQRMTRLWKRANYTLFNNKCKISINILQLSIKILSKCSCVSKDTK